MEITLRPTFKQHLAYEALKNPKIDTVFFGGGAGGGKSWWLCESRLVNALTYPGYKSYIGRKELKRLMQSTYLTWNKVCKFHGIPQDCWKLNGQYNYIEFQNGSRIDLLDLNFNPSDPLYERFGSLEYTDGAIEESGEVEFLAYDVLKSRGGRHMNKEFCLRPTIAITGNPKKNWTYTKFYQPFKKKELSEHIAFIQALFRDNEFTAEEYGKQLASIEDKATKQRLMFGNWEYDDDPATLMNFDAIADLFTNNVQEGGKKYLIADIARYGRDRIAIWVWEGLIARKLYVFQKQGIDVTSNEIKKIAMEFHIPYSQILIDEDGIGGGVVDILRGVKGFVANTPPFDNLITHQPENYQNLKAQCSYKLAELVNNHSIRVEIEDETLKEELIAELEQIKSKDADKDGKKKIVPKEEIKEILGHSPDLSDTLMMRMYFELVATQSEGQARIFVPKHPPHIMRTPR